MKDYTKMLLRQLSKIVRSEYFYDSEVFEFISTSLIRCDSSDPEAGLFSFNVLESLMTEMKKKSSFLQCLY